MPVSQSVAEGGTGEGLLVLGVDTCGASGSVALARIDRPSEPNLSWSARELGQLAGILGQIELAGRTYSATLIPAVGDLLRQHSVRLADLGAIAVVHGPGSFTGIRVGVSAVKGLAEPKDIPVVAASRLAILAAKVGVPSAALDAHRHEAFLRLAEPDGSARQLLAGAEDLARTDSRPAKVAICDDEAAALLGSVWKGTELVRTDAPTAADAIRLCVPAILAGDFADLALLDGHYLRRSDAEIFGDLPAKPAIVPGREIRVRRMRQEDVDPVLELARATHHTPGWAREAYEKAVDQLAQPRRAALVVEDVHTGVLVGFAVANLIPPQAELETIVTALTHQRRGVARELFSSLKNELRHQGAREVILEVRAGNHAARGFYHFLGFVQEGQRPGYYADPVEDAVLMRLSLV